jgi:ubiquinone/menaquinone biosynthesis C-methylase UbiE
MAHVLTSSSFEPRKTSQLYGKHFIENHRDIWNQLAPSHVSTIPPDVDVLLKHLVPTAWILDLGCGYGRVTDLIAQKGFPNIVAVDFSTAMLTRAISARPAGLFCNASALELPFKSGSFDAVTMLGVLCFIWPFLECKKVFREVWRVLRSDGLFLFQDFGVTLKFPYAVRYLLHYRPWKGVTSSFGSFVTTEGFLIHHFRRRELQTLLADFTIFHLKREVYPTMHGHVNRGFSVLAKKPSLPLSEMV